MSADIDFNLLIIFLIALCLQTYPSNNALLINFRLSFDAEILLLSTDWAYNSVPNVQKCVCTVYVFRLSFHFACHPWWLVRTCTTSRKPTFNCGWQDKIRKLFLYYRLWTGSLKHLPNHQRWLGRWCQGHGDGEFLAAAWVAREIFETPETAHVWAAFASPPTHPPQEP